MSQACQRAQPATLYLFKFIFVFVLVSQCVQPAVSLTPRLTQPPRMCGCRPLGPLPGFLSVQGFLVGVGVHWTPKASVTLGGENSASLFSLTSKRTWALLLITKNETNRSGISGTCDFDPKRNLRYFHIHITGVPGISKCHLYSSRLWNYSFC